MRCIYSENSHCEWLIQPQVQNTSQIQYISLQFSRMATECSYDYLYVYDGNNYKSRLLGSFSGRVRKEIFHSTNSLFPKFSSTFEG